MCERGSPLVNLGLLQVLLGLGGDRVAHLLGLRLERLPKVWREPPNHVKVDASHYQMSFFSDSVPDPAYEFPGYRVVVHVPFADDGGVFKLAPSSFTTIWPRGRIAASEEHVVHDNEDTGVLRW